MSLFNFVEGFKIEKKEKKGKIYWRYLNEQYQKNPHNYKDNMASVFNAP